MFMLSMGPGMDMAFPDVCLTPAAPSPVPTPYPNTAMSSSTSPVAASVLIECTPALNMNSRGLVSSGDQSGTLMGASSHMVAGQTDYTTGCFTILVGGSPAQRLGSVTAQNCMASTPNAVGACVCPSQATVLALG